MCPNTWAFHDRTRLHLVTAAPVGPLCGELTVEGAALFSQPAVLGLRAQPRRVRAAGDLQANPHLYGRRGGPARLLPPFCQRDPYS